MNKKKKHLLFFSPCTRSMQCSINVCSSNGINLVLNTRWLCSNWTRKKYKEKSSPELINLWNSILISIAIFDHFKVDPFNIYSQQYLRLFPFLTCLLNVFSLYFVSSKGSSIHYIICAIYRSSLHNLDSKGPLQRAFEFEFLITLW